MQFIRSISDPDLIDFCFLVVTLAQPVHIYNIGEMYTISAEIYNKKRTSKQKLTMQNFRNR